MFELPLHPLVVHGAVVLLPLSALALILLVVVRPWRRRYAWLAVGGVVAGTLAAIGAAITGPLLAESVGTPQPHATLGRVLSFVAGALSIAAIVWWFAQRQSARQDKDSSFTQITGVIAALLAVAVVILTVLAGHSGASAVWGGMGGQPDIMLEQDVTGGSDSSPDQNAAETADPADPAEAEEEGEPAEAQAAISLVQVQSHDTAQSCWAVVDGVVYDLTDWINQHPGGPQRIARLCGTDASAQFTAQHSGSTAANEQLTGMDIGILD